MHVLKNCSHRVGSHQYNEGGIEALKTRPIAHSKNAKLSPEQRKTLSRIILTKDPTSYGFYKALWSRDIIAAVIKTEFNVTMHPASVSRMLRKMGLTPQRPVRKAWQQSEKKSTGIFGYTLSSPS